MSDLVLLWSALVVGLCVGAVLRAAAFALPKAG